MQKTDHLWKSLQQTFSTPGEQQDNLERHFAEDVIVDANQRQSPIPRQLIDLNLPNLQIDEKLRAQLRRRCVELFIGGRSSSSSYLAWHLLPTTRTPTYNLSTLAIDALCFGAIGACFPEPNLSHTARVYYVQASNALLRRINMTVGRLMIPIDLEDVLVATNVLAECTFFEPFRADNEDLQRYCDLLINLIRQYGLPSTSLSRQRYWLERLFYAGLIVGNSITSPLVRSQSTNPEISFFDSYAVTTIEFLKEVNAISNANLQKDQPRNETLEVLHRLGQIIASVKRLHLHWSAETPLLFCMASIRSFKDFHLFHSHAPTPFTLAYRFKHPQDESEFQASTLCILEISQATIRIYTERADHNSNRICRLPLISAMEDAKNAADTLCMLIPRLLEPDNGLSSAIYSTILLRFASAFYRKYKFAEELDWCETVTRAVQTRFNISIKTSTSR